MLKGWHGKQAKRKFTFIDLFCGIGGFHTAASSLGGKCTFACDIDEHARKSYEANYGIKVMSDIINIKNSMIPNHDFLFAGFPCQPFSIIGDRLGFDDIRGTLFFEILRILKAKKPKYALLENVKQLSTHDNKKTIRIIEKSLHDVGYEVRIDVLNALDYGLPQKRERTMIVCFKNSKIASNFSFPKKSKSYKPLSNILDTIVDQKHYASKRIIDKRKSSHCSKYDLAIWHENKGGSVNSYPYSCALRAGASYNYLLVNGERRLTPREMLRLQGYPNSFKIICGDGQTRKQAGNSIPVPMIRKVIREMLNAT